MEDSGAGNPIVLLISKPLTEFEVVFQVRSGLKDIVSVDIYATRVLSPDGTKFSELDVLPCEKVGDIKTTVLTFSWICRHLCPDKVVIQNLLGLSVESASVLRNLAARYSTSIKA